LCARPTRRSSFERHWSSPPASTRSDRPAAGRGGDVPGRCRGLRWRTLGRGPAHVLGPGRSPAFPNTVHDHGPGQPLGAVEHDVLDRAARVDWINRRAAAAVPAERACAHDRGDPGAADSLAPPRCRTERPRRTLYPKREHLGTLGAERAREARGVPAVLSAGCRLYREACDTRGRPDGYRGLRAHPGGQSRARGPRCLPDSFHPRP
jgi:hypothetical protein